MSLSARAQHLLDDAGVEYETLPHREAYTAQGVAAASHVSGWKLAKVVVVASGGHDPLMAVLPASCYLDLKELSRLSGRPDLSLVSEDEMKALFPDCEVGAMPPFGKPYGLPVYVDTCLKKGTDVVFQAGNHHEIVRMQYNDYEALEHPHVADFCSH